MKNLSLFITCIFLSLFSNLSFSQAQKGDIELGFGPGISFATVSEIDNQTNAGARTTFNIAASGEYYFSDRWGIKMKLIYDNKGWGDGFLFNMDTEEFIDTDFQLTYLTIPLMANWHFSRNRNWYLNFGGYAGFLLSAKDSELGMDVKDGFVSTDFGLTLGIGYAYRINENIRIFIEYEEQFGFVDIFEVNAGNAIQNRRSGFNVGVLYQL